MGSDISVDQSESPLGGIGAGTFTFENGQAWRYLSEVAPLDGTLTIQLDATTATGRVVADGVLLVEHIEGQERETVVYDALGQVSRSFDAEQEVTAFTYDTLGRTLTMTSPTGKTTRFVVDLLGRQTAVIDPEGNVTQFGYDDLGQVISEKITLGSTEYTRSYQYDAAGNQTLAVDRNGRARKFTYNVPNRFQVEEWYADETAAENPENALFGVITYYDAVGRVEYVNGDGSPLHYTYDVQDRLTNEAAWATSTELVHDYTGRKDGLPHQLTVKLDEVVDTETTYDYDARLRLTSLVQTNGGVSNALEKKVSFTYDADGRFDTINRYADAAGTQLVVSSAYQYDSEGRLTNLSHSRGNDLLAAYSYAYDSAGRIDLVTSLDGTTDYDYLDDGQLQVADYDFADSGAIPPDDEDVISYDDNGNNDTGSRVVGEHNRPESDGAYDYEYDNEGNRILRTAPDGSYDVYIWDHRNRLIGVDHYDDQDVLLSSVSYVYDWLDRLVSRSYDADGAGSNNAVTERYIYDGNQIILRLNDSTEVQNRYLWGPAVDQFFADEDALNETLLWALGDHQNTIRDLVQFDPHDAEDPDDNETVVMNHLTYTAFGAPTYSSSSTFTTIFGFTGRYFDAIVSLQYNSARWYDPWLQQWVSVDPILFEAGDPNPRRYVGNDPINRIDPSGLADRELRLQFSETKRCVSCHNPVIMSGGSFDDLPQSYGNGAMRWLQTTNDNYLETYVDGLRRQGHILRTRSPFVAPAAVLYDLAKRKAVSPAIEGVAELYGIEPQQLQGGLAAVGGGVEVTVGVVLFVPSWGTSSLLIVDGVSSFWGGVDEMSLNAISDYLGVESLDVVGAALDSTSTELTGGPEAGQMARMAGPALFSMAPRSTNTYAPRLKTALSYDAGIDSLFGKPAYAYAGGGSRAASLTRSVEWTKTGTFTVPSQNGKLLTVTVIRMSQSESPAERPVISDDELGNVIRDRGPDLGQEQGREFKGDQLGLFEFDPFQPKHIRGWLAQERQLVEKGRRLEPKNPPGYEMAHGRTTPAREGYDHSNSRLQLKELNQLEEMIRRRHSAKKE